jgi:Tetratricopeptide repeat
MKCDTIPDLEKFLKIQEQALGESSAEVATTASKLAELYVGADRLDEAERLLKRALSIRQNLVGFHHDEVEKTRQCLEKLKQLKTGGKPQLTPKSVSQSLPPGVKVVPPGVPATAVQPPAGAEPAMTRPATASRGQSISGTRYGAMPETVEADGGL